MADGQPGEMLMRHSAATPRRGFFSGYLNDEAATEPAVARRLVPHRRHGLAQADGMLHFVDRKKNIIRRSGENIAAAEVEAVLLTHPRCAAGRCHGGQGRAARGGGAGLRRAQAADGPPPEQRRRCSSICFERLAYYKAPGWMHIVDTLPTTGTQKIQKHTIYPRAPIRELLPASSTSATASAARRSSGRPGTLPFIPAVAKRRVGPGTVAPWPWVRDGRSAASGMTGRANKRRLRLVNAVRRQSR